MRQRKCFSISQTSETVFQTLCENLLCSLGYIHYTLTEIDYHDVYNKQRKRAQKLLTLLSTFACGYNVNQFILTPGCIS